GRGIRAPGRALARLRRAEPRCPRLHRTGAPGIDRARAHRERRRMTPELKGFLLLSIIKMLVVFTLIMIGVALLTLMERKVSAWMQNRRGPNRVGWAGLLQPAADGVKNILKEETYPALANRWLFLLAPAMSFIPALLLSGVIAFAAPIPVHFDVPVRIHFF